MASIFSGANEAELMGGKTPRLNDYLGRHLVKIKSVESGICKGKNKGKGFYGTKLEVLKSTNPEARQLKEASWAQVKGHEYPEYFFSAIKRFLGAVTGKDPAIVTEENMHKSSSAVQPCKDRIVGVYVYTGSKRDNKTGRLYNETEFFKADANTDLGADMPAAANEDTDPGAGASLHHTDEDPLFG